MKSDPFTIQNLMRSVDLCKRGVSWKEAVSRWIRDKTENVIELYEQIKNGTYRVSDPTVFHITDPKPRTVSATKFRDRVVQRSICECGFYDNVIKSFIYDNCACQKGKGISFAINRLKYHLHRYFIENKTNVGYVIRLDIKKYFPSIPHDKMKIMISDLKLQENVEKIIFDVIDNFLKIDFSDENSFFGGDRVRGLGLGSQFSQLMALLYLSPLDHFIKEKLKVKHYVQIYG